MTERIKLLAKQAGYTPDMFGVGHWDMPECKKFAELIVLECVKVMYDNAIERKVPPDINQTPTHYAIAVLEHFGVNQ